MARVRWPGLAILSLAALVSPPSAAARQNGIVSVRPADRTAGVVLAKAVASCPTVADLVRELDTTDVIVTVSVSFIDRVAADTRWQAMAGPWRYLVVRVDVMRREEDQIAMLGHELQHALEIAGAPAVRDERSLRDLMATIGRPGLRPGTYETNAALEVGERVRRELAEWRGRTRRK